MRNWQSNYSTVPTVPTVHSWSSAITCSSETWGNSCGEVLFASKQLWALRICFIVVWIAWQILYSPAVKCGLTGSLRRRQSQQSFNTLTPFNFLFLYECYMLA
jgi:hypothetical protein